MIKTAKNFSENPEGVLVFTFSEPLDVENKGAKKKKQTSRFENVGRQPSNMKKNMEVFSHETFFFQEVVDYFKSDFFSSKPGENFSLFKVGRYHQITYMGVALAKIEEEKEKRHDSLGDWLGYKLLGKLRTDLSALLPTIKGCRRLEVDLTDVGALASHHHSKEEDLIAAICDAILFSKYNFKKYKKSEQNDGIEEVVLVNSEGAQRFGNIAEERTIVSKYALQARNLVNEPPNRMGVEEFSSLAKDQAKKVGCTYQALTTRQLKSNGLNGILAVNAGSVDEAKLLLLEHSTEKAEKTLLLVGKGVTFDSGGISLKPSKSMAEMKMDMSGAAVVFGAISAISRLGLPLHVVAAIPLTDNMPSSKALKVGDVVEMYGGKTVEVLNTDAEGRLILGDALGYCIDKYKPMHTVDVATLTGAVMAALGNEYAGLFSNDRTLSAALQRSGLRTGEKLWPLPIDDEYNKQLDSVVAEFSNLGGPYGGAITAAKFLHRFVGSNSWAHLDIAGVMSSNANRGMYSRGGTAFGVRLLVDFAIELARKLG